MNEDNERPDEEKRGFGVTGEPSGDPGRKKLREKPGFRIVTIAVAIAALAGGLIAFTAAKHASREDPKKTKARQGCDTYVQAIQKYNSLEGDVVKDIHMKELKGKYITGLETFKDPWRNRYEHDLSAGEVYSKGPDGRHDAADPFSKFNDDDVLVSYIGAPALIAAAIEVNPFGGEPGSDEPAEKARCFDRLHLYFSCPMKLPPGRIDLSNAAAGRAISIEEDPDAKEGRILRYYKSDIVNAEPVPPPADISAATLGDCVVRYGQDSKEIVISFASGYSCADKTKKLIEPDRYYINLTGGRNAGNPLFIGAKRGRRPEEPAQASGSNVLIKKIVDRGDKDWMDELDRKRLVDHYDEVTKNRNER